MAQSTFFQHSKRPFLRGKLSLGEIMAPLRIDRTTHQFKFTGNFSVFHGQKMHFEVAESAKLELRTYPKMKPLLLKRFLMLA